MHRKWDYGIYRALFYSLISLSIITSSDNMKNSKLINTFIFCHSRLYLRMCNALHYLYSVPVSFSVRKIKTESRYPSEKAIFYLQCVRTTSSWLCEPAAILPSCSRRLQDVWQPLSRGFGALILTRSSRAPVIRTHFAVTASSQRKIDCQSGCQSKRGRQRRDQLIVRLVIVYW